jgi:DNA-binding MarR family transcriptional regulator
MDWLRAGRCRLLISHSSNPTTNNRVTNPTTAPSVDGKAEADTHAECSEALPLRISYVIARLDRILRQQIAHCVEPYQLTVSHYTALSILGRRGGLSNAQLARRTYVSPQAMNQLLDQLEHAGLILREPHVNHGRILATQLTEHGKAVLAACDAAVDRLEAEIFGEFSAEERNHLRQTLVTCVRSLHGGFEQVE